MPISDLSGDYYDTVIKHCHSCDEEYLMLEDAERCIMCGNELRDEDSDDGY